MELIGEKIYHKTFGNGTVLSLSDNKIVVEFSSGAKPFIFPDAFERFLTCEDINLQNAIIKILEEKKSAETVTLQSSLEKRKESSHPSSYSRRKNYFEDLVSAGYPVSNLLQERKFEYDEVEKEFGISIAHYGRGINVTDSAIILISSIIKKSKENFVYHDVWTPDGDFIYSGEGKKGDQQLNRGNKALADTKSNNKEIHLFIKFSSAEYYYQGVFELVDYTYEDDRDEKGNVRKEYKFRLRKREINS